MAHHRVLELLLAGKLNTHLARRIHLEHHNHLHNHLVDRCIQLGIHRIHLRHNHRSWLHRIHHTRQLLADQPHMDCTGYYTVGPAALLADPGEEVDWDLVDREERSCLHLGRSCKLLD